jgi:hypothetical protein
MIVGGRNENKTLVVFLVILCVMFLSSCSFMTIEELTDLETFQDYLAQKKLCSMLCSGLGRL